MPTDSNYPIGEYYEVCSVESDDCMEITTPEEGIISLFLIEELDRST